MPGSTISVLMLGDIIGQPGLRAVISAVSGLSKQYRADCVIVNGENAANGFGITHDIAAQLFRVGVSVITTGNHVWRQKGVQELLARESRVLRPQNYPVKDSFGSGCVTIDVKHCPVTVMNLQGREFLANIDCPFQAARELLKQLSTKIIIADFHAESTFEKETFGHYFSGKLSAVMGTHTHVQTGDLKILKQHTAYCTDIGACGPREAVIGFDPESSKRFFLTQVRQPFVVSTQTATIHGVHMHLDPSSGRCVAATAVNYQSKV